MYQVCGTVLRTQTAACAKAPRQRGAESPVLAEKQLVRLVHGTGSASRAAGHGVGAHQ